MATLLETPSRVWRRIEAEEDADMPSLPSLPAFDDSEAQHSLSDDLDNSQDFAPFHSTPTNTAHNTATSNIQPTSNSSSAARFATSIASLSTKSSVSRDHSKNKSDSFDISSIPDIPSIHADEDGAHFLDDSQGSDMDQSRESIPESYLPPQGDNGDEDDASLDDALQSLSRSNSPPYEAEPSQDGQTPKKGFDPSVSLRSEPKLSPFDRYRHVAMRPRKPTTRARTPSLSRTSSSPATSPTHSTPRSTRSFTALHRSNAASPIQASHIPLPRSATASPALRSPVIEDEPVTDIEADAEVRSMDITDIQISSSPNFDQAQSQPQREDEHSLGREPTFSSDGSSTPYPNVRHQSISHSPQAASSAPSTPGPSIAMTPTPAFPRPRARFEVPHSDNPLATPADRYESTAEDSHAEDFQTPHTRRKSFLISVINSTTRPRMKFPTPHPRHIMQIPSTEESTPAASGPSNHDTSTISGVNLQTAFAGVTPRPRARITARRTSHPLAQAFVPSFSPSAASGSNSPATTESRSGSASNSRAGSASRRSSWAAVTPAQQQLQASPYDGAADRASFISTASSHDLTTHHRVNTSFDPAMGFGAGATGHGVGRFNAGKLNNYLHGLNRRLQEENELLLERLRVLEEEKKKGGEAADKGGRRLSGGASRRSSLNPGLGDVEEDVGGEGWMEEKAQLEEMIETVNEELARCIAEREEVDNALEQEREERARDKERWKERMTEVEQGVEAIIKDLEGKLQESDHRAKSVAEESEAQRRDMERRLASVQEELHVTAERAAKAERVMESGKELGGELRAANERVATVMSDLRNANAQIKELEEEVMRSDSRIDELEKAMNDDQELIGSMEEELNARADELAEEKQNLLTANERVRVAEEELRETKAYIAGTEEDAGVAVERLESLEAQLSEAHAKVERVERAEEEMHDEVIRLEGDSQKAQVLARQMEDALEAATKTIQTDEEELANLKAKIMALEREKQREMVHTTPDASHNPLYAGPTNAEIDALEEELDQANREIARLTATLSQSPARRAMDKAKDTKIEMLEQEREELLERNKALRMAVTDMSTPGKLVNASGISPIHRQVLSMSIRAPKTPGAPLRDMSWLNTPNTDPSVSPLIAEITRLQRELDRANESIDDKLDKLEDAGLGVVGLTERLEDARSKIRALEEEIARLARKEDRRQRRLERLRCQKCRVKVDFTGLAQALDADESSFEVQSSMASVEPPTPPTRTSEALKANLKSVNSQLETMKTQWNEERRKLLGEKAVLQDATNQLRAQVKSAKDEARKVVESGRANERERVGVQGELERAKKTIAELEDNLKAERSRLRVLTTEQQRIHREKENVLTQLQRTESDMGDVKQQLNKYKSEKQELETELRQNANADQKARLLEARVSQNLATIEQLRQERSLLAGGHKELQKRYSAISEEANKLRDEYTASSNAHNQRRHELDLHLMEIDDLRRALSQQTETLQRVESEKERISAEKTDVARTVAALEADLHRVKKDAQAFGRDLKALRVEKEKMEGEHRDVLHKTERARKQAQTQIRLLTEQLESQTEKVQRVKDQLRNHVCMIDDVRLQSLKLQHNKECKGLIVQIRYLKAKFTRESSLRCDLAYQKHYLLTILSRLEKSEETILATIARIGYAGKTPQPPPTQKRRRFKSIVHTVMFTLRAKRASDQWREQSSSKKAVAAALDEVRRRRVAVAGP